MGIKNNFQYSQDWVDFFKWIDGLELTKELKGINFFTITKMLTLETKHSALLAWLFDPKANHFLGNIVLEKFFEEIYDFKYPLTPQTQGLISNQAILSKLGQIKHKTDFLALINNANIDVSTERQTHNGRFIDILIDISTQASNTVVVIENKMFTKTHTNQLLEYEDYINKDPVYSNYDNKIFVYLTPGGKSDADYMPMDQNPRAYNTKWCIVSYKEIMGIIDDTIKSMPKTVKEKRTLKTILQHYLELIKNEVLKMGNKALWDIVSEVSRNQQKKQKIVDIYEAMKHKEDNLLYCRDYIKQNLGNDFCEGVKSYADSTFRFYTKKIEQYYSSNNIVFDHDKGHWYCGTNGCLQLGLHSARDKAIESYIANLQVSPTVDLLTNEEWISPLSSIQAKLDANLIKAVKTIQALDALIP